MCNLSLQNTTITLYIKHNRMEEVDVICEDKEKKTTNTY